MIKYVYEVIILKIGIIGSGAYAIALAKIFYENKNDIIMWTKFENEYQDIKTKRENTKSFPNVKIEEDIKITLNIEEVVLNKDIVVIATPSFCFDEIALSIKDLITNQTVVIATKGLDIKQKLFLNDIWKKYNKNNNVCVIAGGSFAIDIVSKYPVGLTLASTSKNARKKVRDAIENNHFLIQESNDIYGVEVLSSIKNPLAIACGIIDGLNLNESTRCMFLTKSLNDVTRLLLNFNAEEKTLTSYAGFGDILLTCTSTKSRNYSYGKILASKDKFKIKEYENTHTIEGRNSILALYELTKEKKIKIEIINTLYEIIYEEKDVNTLLNFLRSES